MAFFVLLIIFEKMKKEGKGKSFSVIFDHFSNARLQE
jgi:hypothetical protein